MFYPSVLLLFFDGHFETFPDLGDLTDTSVHAILPSFPDRTRTQDGWLVSFLVLLW